MILLSAYALTGPGPGRMIRTDPPIAALLISAVESAEPRSAGTLLPAIKAGVKGGFSGRPQETVFEVHSLKETAHAR